MPVQYFHIVARKPLHAFVGYMACSTVLLENATISWSKQVTGWRQHFWLEDACNVLPSINGAINYLYSPHSSHSHTASYHDTHKVFHSGCCALWNIVFTRSPSHVPYTITAVYGDFCLITPENFFPVIWCPVNVFFFAQVRRFFRCFSYRYGLFLGILALNPAPTSRQWTVPSETLTLESSRTWLISFAADFLFLRASLTILLSVFHLCTSFCPCLLQLSLCLCLQITCRVWEYRTELHHHQSCLQFLEGCTPLNATLHQWSHWHASLVTNPASLQVLALLSAAKITYALTFRVEFNFCAIYQQFI